jgi:Mrp family chromosome partitioning ATPase
LASPGSGKRRNAFEADSPNPYLHNALGLVLRQLSEIDAAERPTQNVRSLLITSGPRDRKNRVALCKLLASEAQSMGQRVLLVDGNFASGEPGTYNEGLAELLEGSCSLESLVGSDPGAEVTVLGKGRAEAVRLRKRDYWSGASHFLSKAQWRFDLLIIDGGALAENLPVAPLFTNVDVVIFVAQLFGTALDDVNRAFDSAGLMGRPINGIVLLDPSM